MFHCRLVVKGINLLFLIHRAKLAQGMSPVLSQKWFEKVFPTIVAVIIIVFVAVVTRNTLEMQMECVSYLDSDVFQWCFVDLSVATPWIGIMVDVIITAGLMVLFIVPLYRVYNVDLGVMNANQLQQRKKLRNLLIWSVVLTFINQVSSTLTFLPSVTDPRAHPATFLLNLLWFGIGKLDPSINVWSSWLIITRNRQFVKQVCCCQCISEDLALMRRMSTALTDIPSRTNSLRRLWTKSSVELSAVEIVTSQKPHEPQQSAVLQRS